MKILYIDTACDGHHITYLSELVSNSENEAVVIWPEEISNITCKQYVIGKENYFLWLKNIKRIVKEENPEIVHFIYGDVFYRYFGIGLGLFKRYKTILTLHWLRNGFLRRLSAKVFCNKVDKTVVHSEYIKQELMALGAKNIEHIEYPQFNQITVDKKSACDFWGLSAEIPTIACVGNTRYDKGLDILLEALKNVNKPFQLLVAGKAESFDETYIITTAEPYEDKLFLHLDYLTDEEFANAVAAADIIALPYRKIFNGASGPLGEGVWLNKCIVGPSHGTLGYTIEKNHLGYIFEAENVAALTFELNKALNNMFVADDVYSRYRISLNPNKFSQQYKKTYQNLR